MEGSGNRASLYGNSVTGTWRGGGGCFIWDHEGCVKEALKMGLTSGALLGKLERGSFTRGLERQKEEGSFTGDSEGYAKQGSGNGCLSP